MAKFQPGNPNGWGDPAPLVLLLLLLIFMGGMVDKVNSSAALQDRCQQLLRNQQQ